MPLIARLGDPGTHGGEVITSADRSKAEGVLIARIGDIYACPIHGPNPIVSGADISKCEGKPVAVDGSRTRCGASIVATARKTIIE
jgi:uncharacterized Zn-binding protein involved in type VI secretion